MDTLTFLKDLCAAPGVSGYEGRVRDLIRDAWAPLTTELHVDRLGSLWGIKSGNGAAPRPKIMLAAHMDAIGLMVSQIDGEFLRVLPVGGIDARVMPGQPVTVHGNSDLPGVVVQPPAFLLPKANREGVVPVNELLIDLGLPAAQVAEQVSVGDVLSVTQPPRELQNELLAANRLDNRASVAAVTACLEALQVRPHAWDVVAVATVLEEVTLGGAITAAFALQPQLAIAIDVTFGAGAGVKEFGDKTFPLGGGAVLGFGPNIHPKLHAAIKATAERLEMGYSVEMMPAHSGTDAFGIQVAREGIPTMVVSIPLRNMHTPVEIVSFRDVARTGRLLAEFITGGLTLDFMDTLMLD
jgi:endoglucanase